MQWSVVNPVLLWYWKSNGLHNCLSKKNIVTDCILEFSCNQLYVTHNCYIFYVVEIVTRCDTVCVHMYTGTRCVGQSTVLGIYIFWGSTTTDKKSISEHIQGEKLQTYINCRKLYVYITVTNAVVQESVKLSNNWPFFCALSFTIDIFVIIEKVMSALSILKFLLTVLWFATWQRLTESVSTWL